MGVELNHTIVWCSDQVRSADFLAGVLGLAPPRRFMHFLVVDLENRVSLDYYQTEDPIVTQHYAFLVGDEAFDPILARVRDRVTEFWADPARTQAGAINRYFGGRGVYFVDPDGHLLEVITRPYGMVTPTR